MKLTKFDKKHIPEILGWIQNEREMIQWAGSIFDWPLTQKQFCKHLEAAKMESPNLYPFALLDQDTIIGYCELSNHNHRSNSAIASRILICPNNRSKGCGQEMMLELLEFGFNQLNLNRIGLGVFDFNEPAIACYTKMGFTLEGTMRETAKIGNEYWNRHLMSILRNEWDNS